jgi:hypothetical protein
MEGVATGPTLGGIRLQVVHGDTERGDSTLDTAYRLMIAVGLVLLLIGATAVIMLVSPGAAVALDRESAAAATRNSTSARDIYAKLADTDVAAGALFLAEDETRRAELITAYAITADRVQRALSEAQVHAHDDTDRLAQLTTIADELRVYRKVVDDGTVAGYGTDFAVQAVLASAYAREASHYMSAVLLPSVRRLSSDDQDRLTDARRDGRSRLIAGVVLPALSLLVLAAVQWWLWRRTRRRLNVGLLTATASIAVVLGLFLSSWAHWPAADTGFATVAARMDRQDQTQEQLGSLLSGRADVYLALGASVDADEHRRDFTARRLCVQVSCPALTGVWTARQSGDAKVFASAVEEVTKGDVAANFDAAARSLTDRLASGESEVDAAVGELPPAASQHRFQTPFFLLLAAVAATGGLSARLREYL